jgi:hypothetical protein
MRSMRWGSGRLRAMPWAKRAFVRCDSDGRGFRDMPGRQRARGERRLESALGALTAALNETRAPWMVIGGIAVIARGVRRMTTDLDAAVRGDAITLPKLMRTFGKHAIVGRIADAEAFARQNLVLLLRHKVTGVDLDVSLSWTEFEHEAIATCSSAAFGTVRAPMADPQDLVIFKVVAGRPKDIEDAAALLILHPGIDNVTVRKRVAELAALADDPSLVARLEVILERVNVTRTPRAKRAQRTKRTTTKR